MSRTGLILIALLLVGVWMVACGDETPTTPIPAPAVNHAPSSPTIDATRGAPADGSVDMPVTSWAYWKCTDPDGDALEFDVFFGTSADPPGVATAQTATGYNPGTLAFSTKYYWKIVAKDPDGETATSVVWNFTTTAPVAEAITKPDTPTGPSAGVTGQSLDFDTGNATSNLGHAIEYRYRWGPGNYSTWSSATTASNSWASPGTYGVEVKARCATHTAVESSTSGAFDVVITAAVETLTTPGEVIGRATADVGHSESYRMLDVATSSLGHAVEYRFDWGDGYSAWNIYLNNVYTWTAAGSYDVKGQARCREHTAVESGWTTALTVVVSDPIETIGTPQIINPPTGAAVGEDRNFWSNFGASSEGHAVEYRYDWDDGSMSAWSSAQGATHAWTGVGSYDVRSQARCATHTTIESAWSDAATIDITDTEVISTPTVSPSPEFTIAKGQMKTLIILASSSYNHSVEYFVDWGDGQITDWWPFTQPSHAYAALGDFDIRVKARCRDHSTVESAWSAITVAHVVESITRPVVTGPASGTTGVPVTFNTTGSVSGEGHELEYRLWTSRYYFQSWSSDPWTAIDELTHSFPSAQTWYAKVQARCIAHQTESPLSAYISILINN